MTGPIAPHDELSELASRLPQDEVRVLVHIARRLLAGLEAYGPLDLANDPRDFEREAAEEALDLVAYNAMAFVKAHLATSRMERLQHRATDATEPVSGVIRAATAVQRTPCGF